MKVTKYKSRALESVHVTAKGLFSLGMIDNAKMLKYDRICVVRAAQAKSKNSKTKTGVRHDNRIHVPK